MKKPLVFIFIIIILSTSLFGCDTTNKFGLGLLDKGHYSNNFFGFDIVVDENYTFLTQEQILEMRSAAVDEKSSDNNDVKLEEQPVVYYLYALKNPLEDTVQYNPYIAIYSENLDYLEKRVNSKEGYIQYNMNFATNVLKKTGIEATSSNIDQFWFDDRQFANSILTMEVGGIVMKKELFTILKGHYAITIILGYDKIEDRNEMIKFLDSIKIKK